MKKKIILFLSLLFAANLFGQHYLHLEGRIDNRDTLAWLIKAKIELFTADSALLKTVFTNDSGKYQL